MSELLQNWLNNEVGLSRNVSNFEKDFATGYLFGEILHKFRQQVDFDEFQNKNTYEAKIANFKRLEPTFKALGIKFSATQSNSMMNGERGASLRLLYQLKMAAERLVVATSVAADSEANNNSQGAVTKGIRVPRDQFDSHERRFFEHRLRATGLNVKQARVEKVTRKFELEKHKQEIVAFEMDNIEQAHMEEQRQIHRFSLRERLRQNKAAKDEWEAHSQDLWQSNMQVRMSRELGDIKFNERTFQKHKDKTMNQNDHASYDVHRGVKDFEKGLATLGISTRLQARTLKGIPDDQSSGSDVDEEDAAERLLQQTTKAGTAKELVDALQSRLPSAQELEHEAGLFMRKIKESKHAGSIARRERERRRRRVLVEQQREQEMLEESQLEEVLIDKLGRESIEEAAISYSTWRTQTFEDVFTRNRETRKKEYAARRKQEKEEALRRDQDLLQEMVETMREQEERERTRYRAFERGRHAQRRAKLCEETENILELVTQMAFASMQQEQISDNSEVDEILWCEWMSLFEANVPVSSLSSLAECAAEPAPLTAKPDIDGLPPVAPPGSTLNAAALRDYVSSKGQWEVHKPADPDPDDPDADPPAPPLAPPPPVFDPSEEAKKALEEVPEIPFVDKLSSELDVVDGRPVNYRLGLVVASMLDRTYKEPPPKPPPAMPEVPLRLVMTGKAFSGKKTCAERLAEAYNLQIVDIDAVARECLHLSKRPDLSVSNPVDVLSFAGEAADEHCQRLLDAGNPYAKELQDIGFAMLKLLDEGKAVGDELYVHMVVAKIRSLFPEDIPKEETKTDDMITEEPVIGDPTIEPRGWILTGFPDDATRLALLERFLSGFVDPKAKPTPKAVEMKSEAALLCPRPPEEIPPVVRQPGGCDLHFRLELSLDESVRRASGRRVDPVTNLEYHIEDNPPPHEKSVIYERLVPVDGLAKSMGTMTKRIHKFDVAQPEVDDILEYFGPFPDVPRLVEVDASGMLDETYTALEEQVALLLERKRAEKANEVAEAQAAAEAKAAEEAAKAEAAAAEAAAEAAAAAAAAEAGEQDPAASPPPASATPDGDAEVTDGVEPPLELVEMKKLPEFVEKVEDTIFTLLVEEWRDLQSDFVSSIQKLFGWRRSTSADFRHGLFGIKMRYAEFLQRTDSRQALVDGFVQRFNAFTEEYPDMRKQDATKNELHQRAEELHEKLRTEAETRRSENTAQLEVMQTSRWVESQLEALAAQVQYAVQLEVRRYHSACQLLTDFYYAAMCLGLPEAHASPPIVNAFEEEKEEEPDPKAKKAPPPKKGKDAAPEEPVITPEEKAAQRICKWVPDVPQEEAPGTATDAPPFDPTSGHWEFPFLGDLMTKASKAIWKLENFTPPSVEVPPQEDAPDPKAKAKAKGKADKKKGAEDEAPPPPPMPLPPLFVDLQQSLVAERATFTHQLTVIGDWGQRRLVEIATSSRSTFDQLKDWVVLRRQKELDAADGLVTIIKEHIESEDFIRTKLNLENGHLHRRPNVLLRAPDPPVVPPPVEGLSPFRWTIAQLQGLLEVLSSAAAATSPSARMLPTHTMLNLLLQLTSVEGGDRKPVLVPASWRNCGVSRLKSLIANFEHPNSAGCVDVVEFLLHIGLLHSPMGWPSLNSLLEARKVLETQTPAECTWPDFYVSSEQFMQTALFVDPRGSEEDFAKKFRPHTTQSPGAFDRSQEQLKWVTAVMRRFLAPNCKQEAWELECAHYDFKVRKAEESERIVEMLDDVRTTPSNSPRQPETDMPALLGVGGHDPDSDNNEDAHSVGGVSVESTGRPEKPRPEVPQNMPQPSEDSLSVRQLFSYLCLGASPDEGLARAFAVLSPSGTGREMGTDSVLSQSDALHGLVDPLRKASGSVPAAAAHAAVLQLGVRPMPAALPGDSKPSLPALHKFCEELDNKYGGQSRATDLVGKSEAQEMLKALNLGRRHKRAEVDKLFPKVNK